MANNPVPYNTGLTEAQLETAFDNALTAFPEHKNNTTLHLTADEKSAVGTIGGKASQADLNAHTSDSGIHLTPEERASWDGTKEQSALNLGALGYQRKNLLKNTGETSTKNGVTFTVNSDGSVTVNGTATALTTFFINAYQSVTHGEYKCSGTVNGSQSTFFMVFRTYNKASESAVSAATTQTDDPVTLTVDGNADSIRAVIQVRPDVAIDNVTFYPMIRYAEVSDNTYETYKPSVEERLAALEAAVLSG